MVWNGSWETRVLMPAAAMFLIAVLLAGCGGEKYEPRPVNEAADVCFHCNMAVEDGPFAVQIVTKEKRYLLFDDIGCMNEWKKEYGTDTIGAQYVRDYHTLEWIPYEKAHYVYDPSFKTPMAYGIVSFADESDALAFISEQGKGTLMTAVDLANHSWQRNRDMMEGNHGHTHGEDGSMKEEHSEGEGHRS